MSAADRLEPPLDALGAWHRQGTQHFETMRRLARRAPGSILDAAMRRQAEAVVSYFDRSVAVHHQDEERDLFPALIESMAGSDPVCLREMVAGLTDEHRAFAVAWRGLRADFAAIAAGTPWEPDPGLVDAFIGQCEGLFRRENEELLPMASRLLSDEARAEIIAAMLARRRRGPA
jgi:hemerythrin-like domain-containing protein